MSSLQFYETKLLAMSEKLNPENKAKIYYMVRSSKPSLPGLPDRLPRRRGRYFARQGALALIGLTEATAESYRLLPDWLKPLTNSRKRNLRGDLICAMARAGWIVYKPESQIKARIAKSAWKHSQRAKSVFTVPKLDELL
ncbi:hypothetical protein PG995_002865 [Apiospora arundinis]